ncbi:glycosyltransferase family 8 protein, partial [Ascoidea rubescens DSM 1968]
MASQTQLPNAYVTLLYSSDYLSGALNLVNSLRKTNSILGKYVCLVPHDHFNYFNPFQFNLLKKNFDYLIPIDILSTPNSNLNELIHSLKRFDLVYTLSKIHVFNLFDRFNTIIYLDSDVLVLNNLDHLFQYSANLNQSHNQIIASPDSGWPDIFNSGFLVLKPSPTIFNQLINIYYNSIKENSKLSFDGADQGLLNEFFNPIGNFNTALERDWFKLSFLYNVTPNANYEYNPAFVRFFNQINSIHFIGNNKPWNTPPSTINDQPNSDNENLNQKLINKWWDLWFQVYPNNSSANNLINQNCFNPYISNSIINKNVNNTIDIAINANTAIITNVDNGNQQYTPQIDTQLLTTSELLQNVSTFIHKDSPSQPSFDVSKDHLKDDLTDNSNDDSNDNPSLFSKPFIEPNITAPPSPPSPPKRNYKNDQVIIQLLLNPDTYKSFKTVDPVQKPTPIKDLKKSFQKYQVNEWDESTIKDPNYGKPAFIPSRDNSSHNIGIIKNYYLQLKKQQQQEIRDRQIREENERKKWLENERIAKENWLKNEQIAKDEWLRNEQLAKQKENATITKQQLLKNEQLAKDEWLRNEKLAKKIQIKNENENERIAKEEWLKNEKIAKDKENQRISRDEWLRNEKLAQDRENRRIAEENWLRNEQQAKDRENERIAREKWLRDEQRAKDEWLKNEKLAKQKENDRIAKEEWLRNEKLAKDEWLRNEELAKYNFLDPNKIDTNEDTKTINYQIENKPFIEKFEDKKPGCFQTQKFDSKIPDFLSMNILKESIAKEEWLRKEKEAKEQWLENERLAREEWIRKENEYKEKQQCFSKQRALRIKQEAIQTERRRKEEEEWLGNKKKADALKEEEEKQIQIEKNNLELQKQTIKQRERAHQLLKEKEEAEWLENERKAKEEWLSKEKLAREAWLQAEREENERKKWLDAERKSREIWLAQKEKDERDWLENERKTREEWLIRTAREEEQWLKNEKKAKEEWLERERKQREIQKQLEKERYLREETQRKEQERKDRELAEWLENERKAKEEWLKGERRFAGVQRLLAKQRILLEKKSIKSKISEISADLKTNDRNIKKTTAEEDFNKTGTEKAIPEKQLSSISTEEVIEETDAFSKTTKKDTEIKTDKDFPTKEKNFKTFNIEIKDFVDDNDFADDKDVLAEKDVIEDRDDIVKNKHTVSPKSESSDQEEKNRSISTESSKSSPDDISESNLDKNLVSTSKNEENKVNTSTVDVATEETNELDKEDTKGKIGETRKKDGELPRIFPWELQKNLPKPSRVFHDFSSSSNNSDSDSDSNSDSDADADVDANAVISSSADIPIQDESMFKNKDISNIDLEFDVTIHPWAKSKKFLKIVSSTSTKNKIENLPVPNSSLPSPRSEDVAEKSSILTMTNSPEFLDEMLITLSKSFLNLVTDFGDNEETDSDFSIDENQDLDNSKETDENESFNIEANHIETDGSRLDKLGVDTLETENQVQKKEILLKDDSINQKSPQNVLNSLSKYNFENSEQDDWDPNQQLENLIKHSVEVLIEKSNVQDAEKDKSVELNYDVFPGHSEDFGFESSENMILLEENKKLENDNNNSSASKKKTEKEDDEFNVVTEEEDSKEKLGKFKRNESFKQFLKYNFENNLNDQWNPEEQLDKLTKEKETVNSYVESADWTDKNDDENDFIYFKSTKKSSD